MAAMETGAEADLAPPAAEGLAASLQPIIKRLVAKNTQLLNRFGFASIPTIVGTHAETGALVTKEGALSTAALAALLGLQAPADPAPAR